jgi:hypothetical protein
MNYSELQREVKALLMDQSPTILVSIPDYINEAIGQIAEDIRFPELRQVSTVTTSTSTYYVNMPSTFSSRLKYAGNSDGQFKVLDTLEELLQWYPALDESGDIEFVVCEGGILYYQGIPTTAEAITCTGYHTPSLLVNDTDTPSFIPFFLHREAIVNKAVAVAYNYIEDGVEADKVNTKLFLGLAEGGLNKIREYVSRRRPVTCKSNWDY